MIVQTKIFHAKDNRLFENGKKQKTKIQKAINKWLRKHKIKKIEDKTYNRSSSEDFDETIIIFYKTK